MLNEEKKERAGTKVRAERRVYGARTRVNLDFETVPSPLGTRVTDGARFGFVQCFFSF